MFLNAKTIISAHGSGLTNIIFSQNATVIELHPKNRVKNHYSLLAMSNNLVYYPVYLDVEFMRVSNTNMYITENNLIEIDKILSTLN